MAAAELDETGLRRARLATSVGFLLPGICYGLWFVHIPGVTARLGLEPGILGLALLCSGLGSVITQPISGLVVSRIGTRPTATVFLLALIIAFTFPILAPSVPLLFAGTLALGLAGGALNIAINTQGTEIEAMRGKPTLSSFHGCFSLGTLVGSLVFPLLVSRGLGNGTGVVFVALVMLIIAAVAAFGFPPSQVQATPGKKGASFVLPTGAVIGIALLTFIANGLEGSVNDWSSLYLRTIRGLSESSAATGFAIFAAVMTAMRLFGGPLVTRIGARGILLYGGLFAAAGMLVVVFAPTPLFSAAGFGLVAIGLANTLPVLYSIAARTPGAAPGVNVAAVATTALVGFLVGPPAIGFTAQYLGLPTAIGLLSIAALIIAAAGGLFRRFSSEPAPA